MSVHVKIIYILVINCVFIWFQFIWQNKIRGYIFITMNCIEVDV